MAMRIAGAGAATPRAASEGRGETDLSMVAGDGNEIVVPDKRLHATRKALTAKDDWKRHHARALLDPAAAQTKQRHEGDLTRSELAKLLGASHNGIGVARLENHYIRFAQCCTECTPSEGRRKALDHGRLDKCNATLAMLSKRRRDSLAGCILAMEEAQITRVRVQAFLDTLEGTSKDAVTSSGQPICQEGLDKIMFVYNTPTKIVTYDKCLREIWQVPTQQICVTHREGREVCPHGSYCKRQHIFPTKDCTNLNYLTTGICSNYSKCHCRHPWDTMRWGNHEEALLTHLQKQGASQKEVSASKSKEQGATASSRHPTQSSSKTSIKLSTKTGTMLRKTATTALSYNSGACVHTSTVADSDTEDFEDQLEQQLEIWDLMDV